MGNPGKTPKSRRSEAPRWAEDRSWHPCSNLGRYFWGFSRIFRCVQAGLSIPVYGQHRCLLLLCSGFFFPPACSHGFACEHGLDPIRRSRTMKPSSNSTKPGTGSRVEQHKMSSLFIFPPLLIPNDPNGWIPLCQGRAELSPGVKLGGKDLPEHGSGRNAEYIYISLVISGVLPIPDNLTFSLLNSLL